MRASLKRAIGKLCAGTGDKKRTGTAFLVTREHLFTALHVVADRQHVASGYDDSIATYLQFTFEGEVTPCMVEVVPGLYDPYDDWAVLKLPTPRDDISPIRLGLLYDGIEAGIEAFGYPVDHESLTVAGRIRDSRAKYHGSPALQIYSEEAAAGIGSSLNGLSGAPCLLGDLAVGIVRAHPIRRDALGTQPLVTVRNGTLYACPIELPATALPHLLDSARRLDDESVKRAAAAQEHRSSFQRYEQALRRFALNNTYGLGAARRDSLDTFPYLEGYLYNEERVSWQDDPWESEEPTAAVNLIAKVLAGKKMAVLEGDAGSGKSSTLLTFAAQAWSNPRQLGLELPLLPLFLRLRDIAGASGASVSDRLAVAIGRLPAFAMEGGGVTAQFLTGWPEVVDADPVLVLDALDEVPDQHRLEVIQWLGTVLEQMPRLRLVVSTRSSDLLNGSCFEDWTEAPRVRLKALTHDQAVSIAAAYMEHGATDLVDKLETAGLSDMTCTPLATTLAATVYVARGELPTDRAALYKSYIDVALRKAFPLGQVGDTGFSSGEAKHFLEVIAWSATCTDTDDRERMLQALANAVADVENTASTRAARLRAEEAFQQLTEYSGVLAENGQWHHETFREYLAAQYIVAEIDAGRLQLSEILERHTDVRWRSTLLFLFNIWSSRAKVVSEQQLEVYLPVFDALIGPDADRVGGWIRFLRGALGLSSRVVTPVPTVESLTFAAEAVVELGRAPKRVEERILELLMARRSTIGDTFKNLCRLLFTDEGKPERRVLKRWADDKRLSAHLAPWVARWLLELQGKCEDPAGVAGLILLCHGEQQIENLLSCDALTPEGCAKLVRVCRFGHNPHWRILSVKAVDSLVRRINTEKHQGSVNKLPKNADSLTEDEEILALSDRFLERIQALDALDEAAGEMELDELFERLCSNTTTPCVAKKLAQAIAQRTYAHDRATEFVGRLTGSLAVRLAVLEAFGSAGITQASVALVAIYSQELASTPGNTTLLRKRAAQLENLEDWSAAERDLSTLLEFISDDAELRLDRARAMLNLNRAQEALDDVKLVNQLDPASNFAHYIRGLALRNLNRHRDALQAFDTAISQGFTELRVFRARVNSLYELGLVEEALRRVEEALSMAPSDGDLMGSQVMFLSILGRNTESDELIAEWDSGRKDAPFEYGYWELARLQNSLIADRHEEFSKIAEDLLGMVQTDGWVRLLRLFMLAKASGRLSASDVESARLALEEHGEPTHRVLFFSLIGDNAAACAQLDSLASTHNESDLRWVIVCAKGILMPLLPPSTSSVVTYAQAVLELVEKQMTAQLTQAPETDSEPLFEATTEPSQEPLLTATVLRTKYLFTNGMMCSQYAIESYDEEKGICDKILSRYHGQRVLVMMSLGGTGHVYIQTNVRASSDAQYDFKVSAEFAKLRDYGVLTKMMQEHRFNKVVITNSTLHKQILQAPSLGSLKKCMVLEQHVLPYTSELVRWEMRS